jgi:putative two-component system response regulator
MLTGLNDTQTAIKALSAGASGYLIKPVSPEELLFQTHRSLDHRRLVLDNRNYTVDLERRVLRQTAEIRLAHEETIHRLVAAASMRDEETGAHIRRVGLYSELLAEAIGWSTEVCEQLRLAAPMHDVGKIGIPDAILRKPDKLTTDEYEIMKRHTLIGANVLAGSRSPVLLLAREITLNHHERWDGGGYPNGKQGDEIPETARIVSIVDVYDALTHDRVYRPALSQDASLELMERGRGTQFDPVLLRLFMSLAAEMQRISSENPDESAVREPFDASFMADDEAAFQTTGQFAL